VFSPDSETYAGRTYQFVIVVREKGSDLNKHIYHASVTVDSLDPAEEKTNNDVSESALENEAEVEVEVE